MSPSYSHVGVLLRDHLKQVTDLMVENFHQIKIHDYPIRNTILEKTVIVIGIFHDFGKYTKYFQKHLLEKKDSEYSYHSFVSSVIGFEFIQKLFSNEQSKNVSFLPLIVMEVIRRHHGDLWNYVDEFNNESPRNLKEFLAFQKQLNQILETKDILNEILNDYDLLFEHFKIKINKDEMKDFLYSIRDGYTPAPKFNVKFSKMKDITTGFYYDLPLNDKIDVNNLNFFFLNQMNFSLLIDADKKIASKLDNFVGRVTIPDSIVDQFKSHHFGKPEPGSFDVMRDEFYQNLGAQIKHNPSRFIKHSIFSITAPTGIGKTLSTLNLALRYRSLLTMTTRMETPRIIYCLPYTSIIDQNFKVMYDLFCETIPNFVNNQEQYLLKHHHLNEFRFQQKGVELSNDKALLLTESWQSEVIVTTFYQLFYSLFGYENRSLKKYGKLLNCILILDEIQSFPMEYWKILRSMLLLITKFTQTKVLLMTATQPLIFETGEVTELVEDVQKYYKHSSLDRIRFSFDFTPVPIESVLRSYQRDQMQHRSYLFVLNTILCSIRCAQFIIDNFLQITLITQIESKSLEELAEFEFSSNYYLIYLSTNLPPVIRQKRIAILNLLIKKGIHFIAVTTQLVEAGVDIDAEIAVRDLGPFDCLIQVAGRCNRNNKLGKKGEVKIVSLTKPNNRAYHLDVYDPILIQITRELLENTQKKEKCPWNEEKFGSLIQRYYQEIIKARSGSKSYQDILAKLQYGDLIKRSDNIEREIRSVRDFKIIKKEFDVKEYYLFCDANSRQLFDEYLQAKEDLDKKVGESQKYFENRFQIRKITRKMQQYTIKVPKYLTIDIIPDKTIDFLNIIDVKIHPELFDPLTGFVRKDSGEDLVLNKAII